MGGNTPSQRRIVVSHFTAHGSDTSRKRQLCSSPDAGFGSLRDCPLFEFIAEKRPVKFRLPKAAGRRRVLPTQSRSSAGGETDVQCRAKGHPASPVAPVRNKVTLTT